jgi:hypothetical protein
MRLGGTENQRLAVVGGVTVLGFGALYLFSPRRIANVVADVVNRGELLTDTQLDDTGVIPFDPADLVEIASGVMGREVTGDTYALARMRRSEMAIGESDDASALRIHVALNDLEDLNTRRLFGWSAEDLITYSTNADHKGLFGVQNDGRRYASTKDPHVGDALLAEQVQQQHAAGLDPTGGALKFVDRGSMGAQVGSSSYDKLVVRWAAENLQPYTLPGYSDDFVVFRRT